MGSSERGGAGEEQGGCVMGKVYLNLPRPVMQALSDLVETNGKPLDEVAEAVIRAGLGHLPEELQGRESTKLGVLVRHVREANGLTRLALGGMWNTSGSLVKRVEEGERVNPRTMWVVAAWLQISATRAWDLASQPARYTDRVEDEVPTHPLLQRWLAMDYVTRRLHQAGGERARKRYVVVWLSAEAYGGFAAYNSKKDAQAKVREFVSRRQPVVVCTRYWQRDDPLSYLPEEPDGAPSTREELESSGHPLSGGDPEAPNWADGIAMVPGLGSNQSRELPRMDPKIEAEVPEFARRINERMRTGAATPRIVARVLREAPPEEPIDPDKIDWDMPINEDEIDWTEMYYKTGSQWMEDKAEVIAGLEAGRCWAVDLRSGKIVGNAEVVEELPAEEEGERRFVFYTEGVESGGETYASDS